jgi:hypothetical protein
VASKADFTDAEWDLLVRAPRWVVAGASAAEKDNRHRTQIETEAGFIAVADGRELRNALVTAIAQQTMAIYDQKPALRGIVFTDREAGMTLVIGHATAAYHLLVAKAEATDAETYRRWLINITDIVITAARSGDVFGFGGKLITAAEKRFRERLAASLVPPA